MSGKEIIEQMSLEEKIALCSGKDFWHTKDFKKYGIPSVMVTDGPHGLRKQMEGADMLGINNAVATTCFPTAVTSGATWNRELMKEIGAAIGEEAKAEDVAVVLGPGVNIKRNPLCGRNFEYFSEDPYHSGEMGAAMVEGLQSDGIGASVKHFAANSQEYKRFSSDSQVDERTLREIYLQAFETVVTKAQPKTVMCAYNKINGTFCSDSKHLLTDILRWEWGFHGMVITDWGAMGNRTEGFKAGCDLSMPGGSAYQEKEVQKAVREGRLKEADIDKSAERVLETVLQGQEALSTKKSSTFDAEGHQKLAVRAATEGAVLLKNTDKILPIKEMKKAVLIGHMASQIRYQGAGSSHINPTRLIQVTEVLEDVAYVEGCDVRGNITKEQLKEVERAAKKAETAIVFAGLTDQYEAEGFDRDNLDIPEGHNQMIEAALKGNPNTVVVLMGGSVMSLPWFDKVKGLLSMGLCGQAGGQAVGDLLTGKVSPSGKLTETWPLQLEDVPSYGYYAGERKNAQYREGIYIGYRYYDKAGMEVRFPFGYGLSYTDFTYTDLKVQDNIVSAVVTNSGSRAGAEVVQLYIAPPQDGLHRAKQELKGFEKVFLEPGESSVISFELEDRCFAVYQDGWRVPEGSYEILIGSSSRDIRLKAEVHKNGEIVDVPSWQKGSWYEKPKGRPSKSEWEKLMGKAVVDDDDAGLKKGNFDMDSTLLELKDYSLIARIMCNVIENTIAKDMGIKPDYTNAEFRMAACSSVDASLRSMVISSCGKFPAKLAAFILESANGHPIKALGKLIK